MTLTEISILLSACAISVSLGGMIGRWWGLRDWQRQLDREERELREKGGH